MHANLLKLSIIFSIPCLMRTPYNHVLNQLKLVLEHQYYIIYNKPTLKSWNLLACTLIILKLQHTKAWSHHISTYIYIYKWNYNYWGPYILTMLKDTKKKYWSERVLKKCKATTTKKTPTDFMPMVYTWSFIYTRFFLYFR